MTRKQNIKGTQDIKALIGQDGEFLRPKVHGVPGIFGSRDGGGVGGEKGERTQGALELSKRLLSAQFNHAVGKLELRDPQDRLALSKVRGN